MKKKNAFWGMVLLQISILIVFIVATVFKEPAGYEFAANDLVNIEDIGEGQIILSPYITLPIGSYKVYAEYELEGQNGDFSIVSFGTASEDILTNSSVVLREGKHILQNDFRVRWKLDGVSIKFQTMAGERINVKHVGIMETNAFLKQSIVYLFGLFAVIDGIIFFSWYWKNSVADEKRMSRREVGSVILIALLASLPLGLHYLLNGQDMEFHLLRIEGLYEALRCGQFPVRIHPNYMEGYGYPTGIFYPELFLYFPALLRLMGVPLMHAYKWFVLAQNIATAGVAWYSGKILFQKKTRDRKSVV